MRPERNRAGAEYPRAFPGHRPFPAAYVAAGDTPGERVADSRLRRHVDALLPPGELAAFLRSDIRKRYPAGLVPVLIGGGELHNNHHAYPTSAKLSSKWYEFDIGWLYIRALEVLGLAQVKHVAPVPHFSAPKPTVDPVTLQAVIACRYDVHAKYARYLKRTYAEELAKLKQASPEDAQRLRSVEPWLNRNEKMLREPEHERLAEILPRSRALQTMIVMRRELATLWGRSTATREQLVAQLQDWCRRAETSGIRSLEEFSQRLRSYS